MRDIRNEYKIFGMEMKYDTILYDMAWHDMT
jgi:hypothetical protein